MEWRVSLLDGELLESEAVAVEAERLVEVVDGEHDSELGNVGHVRSTRIDHGIFPWQGSTTSRVRLAGAMVECERR